MREAGFAETYVEQLTGVESMVVGIKIAPSEQNRVKERPPNALNGRIDAQVESETAAGARSDTFRNRHDR